MGEHVSLREAEAVYSDTRGRAMGTSTVRLRWQVRRLPRHTSDQRTLARLKAITDELRYRGALAR